MNKKPSDKKPAPDEWISICPECKRFHRDHKNCAAITTEILEAEKQKWKK